MSLLVKVEILEVFANTLTANEKYPVRDSETFLIPIQRILS